MDSFVSTVLKSSVPEHQQQQQKNFKSTVLKCSEILLCVQPDRLVPPAWGLSQTQISHASVIFMNH